MNDAVTCVFRNVDSTEKDGRSRRVCKLQEINVEKEERSGKANVWGTREGAWGKRMGNRMGGVGRVERKRGDGYE